jgi:Zn-finger nucleic acid-binding protein
VRARVDAKQPFHLDRCPVCAGIWFDAGEWAAIASTEWLSHLEDLWDPVWRKRARAERAVKRHHDTLVSALGKQAFAKLLAAIEVLREHPMRSLGLSFLIEELRGPDNRGNDPAAAATASPATERRARRRTR